MDGIELTGLVLATGAIGTAAFGVVDGLKTTSLGLRGFEQIKLTLGKPLIESLNIAYGTKAITLLQAQYRNGRSSGSLPKTLRRGTRIGLTPENAHAIAGELGTVDGDALAKAAASVKDGRVTEEQRDVIARFELAVDARIDAALSLAESKYKGAMRNYASVASVVLTLIAAYALKEMDPNVDDTIWIKAVIVGLAAVPIAPVAKDIAKCLQSAAKALKSAK